MDAPKYTKLVDYCILLYTNADFMVLWLGEVATQFGNWFNFVASYRVVESLSGGSGLAIAMLLIVRNIPRLVWFPFAGAAADTYNRGHVMLAASVLQSLLVATVPVLMQTKSLGLFFFLNFLEFSLGTFYDPARSALIPMVVPQHQLILSSTLDSFAWSLMGAVGASMGGFAVSTLKVSGCFYVDAATFLVAALCAVRVIPVASRPASEMEGSTSPSHKGLTTTKRPAASPFTPKIKAAAYRPLNAVPDSERDSIEHTHQDCESTATRTSLPCPATLTLITPGHQQHPAATDYTEHNRDSEIRDPFFAPSNPAVALSDSALTQPGSALVQLDSALAQSDSALAQSDSALAQSDCALAQSDSALSPFALGGQQCSTRGFGSNGKHARALRRGMDVDLAAAVDARSDTRNDDRGTTLEQVSRITPKGEPGLVSNTAIDAARCISSQGIEGFVSNTSIGAKIYISSMGIAGVPSNTTIDAAKYNPHMAASVEMTAAENAVGADGVETNTMVEVLHELRHKARECDDNARDQNDEYSNARDQNDVWGDAREQNDDYRNASGQQEEVHLMDQEVSEGDHLLRDSVHRSVLDQDVQKVHFHAFRKGFRYIRARENRDVLLFVCIKACGALSWGGNDVLNAKWSEISSMQLYGDESITIGIIYGMVGLGCFFGPLLSNSYIRATPAGWLSGVALGFALRTAGYLVMSVPRTWLMLISTPFRAAGSNILWISSTALLQSRADNQHQGCVFALELAVYTIAFCISTMFTGLGFDSGHWSPSTMCLALASLTFPSLMFWSLQAYIYAKRESRHSMKEIRFQALELADSAV